MRRTGPAKEEAVNQASVRCIRYQNPNSEPTMMKRIFCLAASVVIGAAAPSARAVLLAYEGFDYTPGESLLNQNGGFGFSGPWLTNATHALNALILPGSFTYTDSFGNQLITSGHRAFVTGDGTATGDNTGGNTANGQPLRVLSFQRGAGSDPDVTWISFLALRTGQAVEVPDPQGHGSIFYNRGTSVQLFWQGDLNSTAQGSERLSIGRATQTSETDPALATAPNDTWAAVNRGAANQSVISSVPLTNVVFVVMRINHEPGVNPGNDTAYLWLNPPNLTVEPDVASATMVINASQFALNDRDYNFDRIRIFAGNLQPQGYGSIELDEIRIGTTFWDVAPIPEPGVPALMGLGALVALMWFRRR